MKMERTKKRIEHAIATIAKKSASIEANAACSCLGYQPKESEKVRALRKF